MTDTPWSEFVTKTPCRFNILGGPHRGTMDIHVETPRGLSCQGGPYNGTFLLSLDRFRSTRRVEAYRFASAEWRNDGIPTLCAHPIALMHLFVRELVTNEQISIFAQASNGLDTLMNQRLEGQLAEQLFGTTHANLTLCTTYDLSVQ